MSRLSPVYSPDAARAAENCLLAREDAPDDLMKQAASACAAVALAMLPMSNARVLIVAGPGGNGGDGLFAGAHIALAGHMVHAVFSADTAHVTAVETFQAAGGVVSPTAAGVNGWDVPYDLVIDAVAGLGSSRAVDEDVAALINRGKKVLAIDAPTGCGVQSDSGASVIADVTVTFGHARTPHSQFPECGEVVIADIGIAGMSLAQAFEQHEPVGYTSFEPSWVTALPEHLPDGLRRLADTGPIPHLIPGISDNKYTHGVTGIAAGSHKFPGAGILCTAGALYSTTSMVVALGDTSNVLTARFPEVVPVPDVASAPRVHAWVIGPGRGTDGAALEELEEVLDSELPVVIDADGLTLIAQHPHLHKALRERNHHTVLTPHAGEFARLTAQETKNKTTQQELSDALGCHILHKGRVTTITSPGRKPLSVNTGNSFAATAGSGDVLAGIIGALLAVPQAQLTAVHHDVERVLLSAVAIHAHAAAISAQQPEGYAPTTAMGIAEAVGESIARLHAPHRGNN